MTLDPKSIAEHIECLARLTGAPSTFVVQVRELFSKKGISLASDATPYLRALDEAFRREESIRANTGEAAMNFARSRSDLTRIGRHYHKQTKQLRRIRTNIQEQTRRLRAARGIAPEITTVAVPGDHRTYVTRPQTERLPMVPGPKDPQ